MRMLAVGVGVLVLVLVCAGCAKITVPVSGRIGGQPVSGETSGTVTGEGVFAVTLANGGRCSGTYDPLTMVKKFTVPVECTDGRTGVLDVERKDDGVSGTATGRLSDGTLGQFVFGSYLRYDDEFPGPDATAQGRKARPSVRGY